MNVKDKIVDYLLMELNYLLMELNYVICDSCEASLSKCLYCTTRINSLWPLSENKAHEMAKRIVELVGEVDNE